jgi:hypothetical protein
MLTRTSSSNVKPTVTCVLPEKHSSKAVNFDDQTCELVHRSRILVLKLLLLLLLWKASSAGVLRHIRLASGTIKAGKSRDTGKSIPQHAEQTTLSSQGYLTFHCRYPRSHLQPCSFMFAFSLCGIYLSSAILGTHSSSPAGI